MASNVALHPTKNHRWFSGFGNIFSKENHQWWGTRQWLIQVAVWLVLINGLVLVISVVLPNAPKTQQALQAMSASEAAEIKETFVTQGLTYFFILSGMVAGAGVVVFAQDALIGEKRAGTAAWLLSKPVSRTAFLLAKLAADAIGIFVTIVIVQGVIGYFIIRVGTGINLQIPDFLAALGLVTMFLFFLLSLVYMLGTLSNSRGLVVGVPLLFLFFANFGNVVPVFAKTMPWNLITDMRYSPSMAIMLARGEPLTFITPIIGTAVMTVLFIIVAVWRINREEF
jgi:ABC-2 type transport system permease protein